MTKFKKKSKSNLIFRIQWTNKLNMRNKNKLNSKNQLIKLKKEQTICKIKL